MIMQMIIDIWRGFLSLVAPSKCPACDAITDTSVFCSACAPLLEPLENKVGAYAYGGPLTQAITRMKYNHRPDIVPLLAHMLEPHVKPYTNKVDVVVPVPLYEKRRYERGYDQSALLAREVAGIVKAPMKIHLLQRVRNTGHQVGRDAVERKQSMDSAFLAKPAVSG